MNRTIKLSRNTSKDAVAARAFYEDQAEGLGEHFRDSINQDLLALSKTAGVHRTVRGLHRCPCRRFPFAIYYRVEGNAVLVYAILDSRRDPEELERILSGR